jgi:small multidrug resistance pump
MAWIYLLLAILFEVTGTTSMKLSEGFKNVGPSIAIFVCYGASIGFLTLAVREIEISVAYAVWCAIGIGLIAIIGIVWFQESTSLWKLLSLGIIVIGVISLQLSDRAGG